jgi:hypothetical protein
VALSSCSNAGESEKNKEPFNLKGDDMKVMFKSTETSCSRLKEGHDADLPKRAAKRRQSSSSSLHHLVDVPTSMNTYTNIASYLQYFLVRQYEHGYQYHL